MTVSTDRHNGARVALLVLGAGFAASTANAGPPPSGPHPRLFASPALIAAYAANAKTSGTAAAGLVARCQDTIDTPKDYVTRGGSDGDSWPGSAVRCAFAYLATKDAKYLTQALKYWHASLDDDQTLGDKQGCVAGVATDWKAWDGNPPAPAVIRTVTHDTGYPMRWYGPDVALTYDWLYAAPGVDAGLLAQTRTCLGAWSDYYTAKGYHADEAGANYNAGYVIGKTFSAIAIGTDGGADGHLWTETTGTLFPKLLVGAGLAGSTGAVGTPAGPMVGGDWAEGWQYGPLSVLEYAVAARALAEAGAPQPEMAAWVDSLSIRYVHGTVPALDGQWVGGDFDATEVYAPANVNELDAVLAGQSTDAAASWAAYLKQAQSPSRGVYVYNALAETRAVAAVDFRAQNPSPSRWYLARGTRALYARTSWDAAAYWGVFSSAPEIVSDHEHLSASSFVFSRGSDHLIVDPSNYGEVDTLETNALTVESTIAPPGYLGTQTPWSEAELVWARGTEDAVYAARSDFAKAFIFASTPSDVPYAHREWVMLPEGEVVTIDRVHTADAAHAMILGLHANTAGKLAIAGGVASGAVGASQLAIHAVHLSGGTPAITKPHVGSCTDSCSYPCGQCDASRFAVDKYTVKVPGPWAVAVHVIDALAAAESPATVGSLNDDAYDPAPKENAGVLGAAVYRASKQTYVVASSAMDGASPSTMTYGVPGGAASRHVVFDAPEDAIGASTVVASAAGGRCVVKITAGAGFSGRPLMFGVSSAADGCKATASTDVASGPPPLGTGGTGGGTGAGGSMAVGGATGTGGGGVGKGGSTGVGGATGKGGAANAGSAGKGAVLGGSGGASAATGAAPAGDGSSGGCGCRTAGERASGLGALGLVAVLGLARRRRASRRSPPRVDRE